MNTEDPTEKISAAQARELLPDLEASGFWLLYKRPENGRFKIFAPGCGE